MLLPNQSEPFRTIGNGTVVDTQRISVIQECGVNSYVTPRQGSVKSLWHNTFRAFSVREINGKCELELMDYGPPSDQSRATNSNRTFRLAGSLGVSLPPNHWEMVRQRSSPIARSTEPSNERNATSAHASWSQVAGVEALS